MLIRMVAAGTRMPAWVQAGFAEYTQRLGPKLRFELKEIALGARPRGGDAARAVAEEGRRMLAAVKDDTFVVALEVEGRRWSTAELTRWLEKRLEAGRELALLIGGPDGLARECLERSDLRWSLSPLTLPHGLVRVVVAEQLYRALTIIEGHPYHRA